jgi:hypothetical protein
MKKQTPNRYAGPAVVLAVAVALLSFASQAQAELIDLRRGGSSWVSTTVSSNAYTVVGTNDTANSVYAGTSAGVDRWDATNTSPAKNATFTGVNAGQIVRNPNVADSAFANLGTSIIRLNAESESTTPVSSASWNVIAQANGYQDIVFGLSSSGEVGRAYYSGTSSSWVDDVGHDLNNSTTGYTSIAAEWNYTAGRAMYSSGGGNGLGLTRFNHTWVFEHITDTSYDLLATVPSPYGYAVYGANSSGLDFHSSPNTNPISWQTTNINSKAYTALAPDLDQDYVLFGLTSTGVDKISSTDGGATWTTEQILPGAYTGIADNAGVANAVYLIR